MIAPPPFPSPKFPTNDVANSRLLCDGKREGSSISATLFSVLRQYIALALANPRANPTRLLPLPKQRPSFFTLPAERRASERRLPRRRERLNGERDGRRRRWQAGSYFGRERVLVAMASYSRERRKYYSINTADHPSVLYCSRVKMQWQSEIGICTFSFAPCCAIVGYNNNTPNTHGIKCLLWEPYCQHIR